MVKANVIPAMSNSGKGKVKQFWCLEDPSSERARSSERRWDCRNEMIRPAPLFVSALPPLSNYLKFSTHNKRLPSVTPTPTLPATPHKSLMIKINLPFLFPSPAQPNRTGQTELSPRTNKAPKSFRRPQNLSTVYEPPRKHAGRLYTVVSRRLSQRKLSRRCH